MKRYRVLPFFDFDTRATVLSQEIKDEWEPNIKRHWLENKKNIKEDLIAELGALKAFAKIDNFVNLGPAPFSIIAFHNKFLQQARGAFIIGSFYPALTAVCALGERVLNQLILTLRDDYKQTPEYKNMYGKNSFADWELAISTLESWHILLDPAAKAFRELKDIRNKAIHFNPATDTNDREIALSALKKFTEIVNNQFSGFGTQPWFIANMPGESYIKKSWEEAPFIKKIFLPNCVLVGPKHEITSMSPQITIRDNFQYEKKEVTDSEFSDLRREHLKKG
jgi:hypothetical protein